jgi:uncharacterized protein with von Willebrand factor type A (vWA) domain
MMAPSPALGLGNAPVGALQARLVEFVRLARANGYRVGVAEEVDAQQVAACCGIDRSERLRWGLRSLLCSSEEDWRRFDALFDAFWLGANARSRVTAGAGARTAVARRERGAGRDAAATPDLGEGEEGGDVGEAGTRGGASGLEALRYGDFGALADGAQQRAMARLVEALARRLRRRLTRREQVRRKGRRVHLRRTLRNSLARGGTPVQLAYRERRRRRPRLVLITDVSRSMSLYSFMFLRFARGIVTSFQDAAAFACHTRLVPITDALRHPDTTRVMERLGLISQGWSGGTRLGESLASFNRDYGRLVNRRTLVIVVSDGLDTGEPAQLAGQLAVIKARCCRLIWLNPLLGRPGYEPRTGAMRAALPYLDRFAPAHNLQSLTALETALAEL